MGALPRFVVTTSMETGQHSDVFSSAWVEAQSRWRVGISQKEGERGRQIYARI